MTEPTTTTAKRPVRLMEGEMRTAEYDRAIYCVTAPPGTRPEDYLESEVYAHVVGRKLKQGDRLEITAEDRTWFAEVMIVTVSGQMVQAEILHKHSFAPLAGKEHDAYEVMWAGPAAKWRVMRKSDRHVMIDKLESKSAGVAWVEENAKAPLKQAA